jgi:hypothetical protein
MADTLSFLVNQDVFGDRRVNMGRLTAGASTVTSKFGLNVLEFAIVTAQSAKSLYCSPMAITTTFSLQLPSCNTGDIFNVIAFGK